MIRAGKQTGYILLPVIVVITLVAAIALLMTTESALESNTAGNELDAQQAQYVAEAGLNHALWMAQQQGCGPYSDLTNEPLGNDNYTTNLTTDLGSTTAYTINVDQDSWIRSDQPTINKAADLNLHVRNEAAGIERILLRYDLSPIAANASILSATAWFYVTASHPEGPIDIHLTRADWIETDATWDSMNANMDAGVLATIPGQSSDGVWRAVNLTAQAQAWVNGAANYGITLNSTVDGVHGQYQSRESSHPPYLEVIVGTPPTSPAKLIATGKIDGGGAATIKRDVTLVQQPPANVVLQLGADPGEDAMLDSFYGLRNYGGANYMQVHDNESDWQQYPLIRFHLNRLPQGAVIHSARLELRLTSLDAPGSAMVHQVTRDWVEGTKSGGGTADGATWGTYDGTNAWTTAGGDIDSSVVAETAINGGETWVGWDVTQLVERWSSGVPNYGLLIKPDTALNQARFASKEDADPALWPRLTISYSCTCGQVCMAPQGSGKIALIGDDATPDPDDQIKIAIIESWGYDIDFYEDQAADTINWSNYDLAYVSETTISSGFSGDPAVIPIGVVNEEPKLYDEFLLASGDTEHVGDTIDIVDNSHYITAVFPQGALPIYTGAMEILSANTPLAADLQILGEFSGAASLTALEKGAMTTSGTGAAARRVTLPLGQHFAAGFDWSKLNSNGYLLVQRAIEWGMGKDKVSSGNVLLVVVNPSSLNAQEDAKKALIEGWDYTVNLIDESDSQANFDTAAAVNDVAYIPQDINSLNLGSKLRDAAIGVVNEEGEQVDELGISQDKLFKSRHEIDVIDNGHYITQPFATGLLTFTSSDQSVHMLAANQAPGLLTLAESLNTGSIWKPSLAVLKTGDDLWGGGTAAGRRVQLPWGGGTFDINQLNDDGRTIMQRALEWGAGAGCAGSRPLLLLVVGDATTLSSKDDGMKTLVESWCYQVEVIDDGDSQASFDALAAAADVVYVSGTTSGPALQDKLTGSPTPIVNEINGKLDNFGFSSSTASSVIASAFSATNASHYISEPFAGGPVTFFTTDLPMPVPAGTLAPGLRTAGETTGSIAALVTLNSGAQRWDGNPAPARRVHLPFTNAETSQLTADGKILMQRSIEWAAGIGAAAAGLSYRDEITNRNCDAADYTGSNGSLDWSPWTWAETSDDSTSCGGNIDIREDPVVTEPGNYRLKFSGNNRNLARQADLSAFGEAHLSFDYRADSVSNNVSLVIEVWDDALSIWMEVGRLTGPLDETSYTNISFDISPYISANAAIRVRSEGLGLLEEFYLDNIQISETPGESGPSGPGYTEMYQTWSATSDNTWQTVNLGAFDVPGGAVVEVAVINRETGRERYGGVRAVGSSLERRFRLHEAENGGVDAVTMHVQADTDSQIQHYSERKANVTFVLLGYWTGTTYEERFDAFKAGANASWQSQDLGTYGVGPDQVAELALSQTSTSAEWLVGARRPGSALTRLLPLHEAESGGIDMVTLMTGTDASSIVEVYAEADSVVDFHLLGYWSTPPGTYTETGGVHGQATVDGSWLTTDLSSFGIPANSIAQFVLSNERDASENQMGLRETGSTIPDRRLDLQEAESGGGDLGTMHVNVDSASSIEWYSASGTTERFFYPVGWWVLAP